ncbi:hypothetical protein JW835_04755 [bacterium]|nr:hypothetical protein [bacterium]RQV97218.1 MAG: hypothetical protein EH221_04070 [bacterium]
MACFLTLLIISVVVSAVLHFVFKLYVRPGINSFISKVILGYIGAWQGSAVFGEWLVKVYGVSLIPAILGSLALLILMVDLVKTVKTK